MSESLTSETRVIPYWPEHRVETGSVQFGNDWPGTFIRGDNAAHYAIYLRLLLGGKLPEGDAISKGVLMGLLSDLEASRVR